MSYSPLAPEFTEDKIKAALDGTFTRFDIVSGGVKTTQVDTDYQATHCVSGSRSQGVSRVGYKHFTNLEDEMIIGLKDKGYTSRRIGMELNRDDTAITHRYKRLIRKGRCQAVVS